MDMEKLEKMLENANYATNEKHKSNLKNRLLTSKQAKQITNMKALKTRTIRVATIASAVFLFFVIGFSQTSHAQKLIDNILSKYKFQAAFDYYVMSEEEYAGRIAQMVSPLQYQPENIVTKQDQMQFIEAVNEDFKGLIFDKDGNPLESFYYGVDSGVLSGAITEQQDTVYFAHDAYNAEGNKINKIGKIDEKYVPQHVDESIYNNVWKTVAFSEAEDFLDAKIKMPYYLPENYVLDSVTVCDIDFEQPYRKIVFISFVDEANASNISYFVEKVKASSNDEPEVFYVKGEPTINQLGSFKVYDFEIVGSSGMLSQTPHSQYVWSDDDLVYHFNKENISEDEAFAIIKSMK